ncbi:MAG: hypothetical protein ACLSAF_16725 [Intestinimonas sp.]
MSPLHSGILLLSYFQHRNYYACAELTSAVQGLYHADTASDAGAFTLSPPCFLRSPAVFSPTGGARKPTCLLSVALVMAAFMLLLSAGSLPLVAAAMVLWGQAAPFSSGSLDALIIDACLEEKGRSAWPR